MLTPQQRIKRVINSHRKWLLDSGTEILEDANESLKEDLSERSLPALRCTTISLQTFALYYGTKGVIGLAEGAPDAWDNVFLSAAFRLNSLRLNFALWTRLGDQPGFGPEISNAANAFCFALANNLPEWRPLFAEMINEVDRNPDFVGERYWKGCNFEPFSLQLSQINARTEMDLSSIPSEWGMYADILTHWHSPELLAQAMVAACDYHCQNMTGMGGRKGRYPEFRNPPFDLIPWEILAIQQVRKRLGLPTPELDHPLLKLSADFVPRNELPYDDRIREVEWLRESLHMTVKYL